jgi:hypothetical protein
MKQQKAQKFVERTAERRDKSAEGIVDKLLVRLLEMNLPFYDVHYIDKRVRQILEQTYNKLNFKSEVIEAARKEFLAKMLDNTRNNLWGFSDEYNALRTKKKDSELTDEEKKRLVYLRSIVTDNPKDATADRDLRCEPAVKEIIGMLLTPELLLGDMDYLEDAIENDDELLLSLLVKSHMDAVYNKMIMALAESERRAQKILWGNKEREDITFKNMDMVLKGVLPSENNHNKSINLDA